MRRVTSGVYVKWPQFQVCCIFSVYEVGNVRGEYGIRLSPMMMAQLVSLCFSSAINDPGGGKMDFIVWLIDNSCGKTRWCKMHTRY